MRSGRHPPGASTEEETKAKRPCNMKPTSTMPSTQLGKRQRMHQEPQNPQSRRNQWKPPESTEQTEPMETATPERKEDELDELATLNEAPHPLNVKSGTHAGRHATEHHPQVMCPPDIRSQEHRQRDPHQGKYPATYPNGEETVAME
ncbi:hypothetical protein NDU88_002216 [Pleurodeles waltl]|uniref:Uncharacterized protein n=1 Tax=Pleurodeles waltl TaxID=8319 RepID=A0AAV7VDP2_PLEWA|nr:hypothetical protein NDU88_002216 [Pleurodeles waltl]